MSRVQPAGRDRRVLRGATLLEMMIVVAILGILTALAGPQLIPIVKQGRLHGEGEAVASFLDAVRRRAMADGRCYRVTRAGTRLQADRRDSGDCVNLSADDWTLNVMSLQGEAGSTYELGATDALPAGLAAAERLVFRPSGRLRGDGDLLTSDDLARVVVGQTSLNQRRVVLVTAPGRVCVLPKSAAPPAITITDVCP